VERRRNVVIAVDVPLQFRTPEVLPRGLEACRESCLSLLTQYSPMPEIPVHEYRDPFSRENDVGTPFDADSVQAIPKAHPMQGLSQRNFCSVVPRTDSRHHP
jgi:hypothetical protein